MNAFSPTLFATDIGCLPCCCTLSVTCECEAMGVYYYCDPGHVPPFYSKPVDPSSCSSVWYPSEEIDCDGVAETVPQGTITFSVRATASCLVVGREYKITFTFSGTDQLWCCDPGDDCPADEYPCPEPWTSTTEITFTATATTETTSWVAAPVADGSTFNELNTVEFTGCTIEAL